jgi:hypothetical protein
MHEGYYSAGVEAQHVPWGGLSHPQFARPVGGEGGVEARFQRFQVAEISAVYHIWAIQNRLAGEI